MSRHYDREKGPTKLCGYCGKRREHYKTHAKKSRCIKCWSDYYQTQKAERVTGEELPCKKCGQPGKRLSDGKIRCDQCVATYRENYKKTKNGKIKRKAGQVRYQSGEARAAAQNRLNVRKSKTLFGRLRNRKMWQKYKLTISRYCRLVHAQQGCCAICGVERWYDLCVDHNHTTNAQRDLLCQGCNIGIGTLMESPAIMHSAIAYVERHASKSCDLADGYSTPNLFIPGSVVSTATAYVGLNLSSKTTG